MKTLRTKDRAHATLAQALEQFVLGIEDESYARIRIRNVAARARAFIRRSRQIDLCCRITWIVFSHLQLQCKTFSPDALHACSVDVFRGPARDKLRESAIDTIHPLESAEAV